MTVMVDELEADIDVVKRLKNGSEADRVFEMYGVKRTKNFEGHPALVIFTR